MENVKHDTKVSRHIEIINKKTNRHIYQKSSGYGVELY